MATSALPVRPSSLLLLWRESRPVVQVVFAARCCAGVALSARAGGHVDGRAVLAVLGCSGAVMATYLCNGASDAVEDRANGSLRPLAQGQLSSATATRAAVAATVAGGVLAAASGSLLVCALVLALAGLGWAYSTGPRPLKRSSAGAALACSGGGALAYAVGAVAAGGRPAAGQVVLLGLLSLFMAVAGASKDFADVVGDALAGRGTLPVRWGLARARVVVAAGAALLAAGALADALLAGPASTPAALLAVGAGAFAVLALRVREGLGRRETRRPYRAFMVTQYVVNAVLLFSW